MIFYPKKKTLTFSFGISNKYKKKVHLRRLLKIIKKKKKKPEIIRLDQR